MSQEQQQPTKPAVWLCAQCDKPADKRYLEKLPNNGITYLAMHHDGSEPCRLGEFIAREKPTRKRKKQNKVVTCPKCGEIGNLWTAGTTPLKPGRPEHERGLWITYEVVHGKGHKDRNRHRITDPAQRANLLEQLGRLLDKSLLTEIKKKRGPGRPPKLTNKKLKVQPQPQPMITYTPSPDQNQFPFTRNVMPKRKRERTDGLLRGSKTASKDFGRDKDMKAIVKKPETNLMSSQLLGLIKKAAKKWVNTIAEFRKLWEEIKEQGQKEGFQEKELRVSIRDELDRLGVSRHGVYYFFHREQHNQRSKLDYQKRVSKSRINATKRRQLATPDAKNGNPNHEDIADEAATTSEIKFNPKYFNVDNIRYYDIQYLKDAVLYFFEECQRLKK
jgi:hypothetical protein